MTEVLIAIVAFLIAIVVLISIHEFGHFWVAKKCGVSVLNFSIGFGKSLFSWQNKQTTYHIKAIPLGGFVDMLDGEKDELTPENKHQAFDQQSVYKRFIIVLAGPLANIVLAIFLYALLAMVGTPDIKPIIAKVQANSIADLSGLRSGDTFTHINQKSTPGIQNVVEHFISNQKSFNIQVLDVHNQVQNLQLVLPQNWLDEAKKSLEERLGFAFYYPSPEAVIDEVVPDSAAQKGGLLSGDKITAINGLAVNSWLEMTSIISAAPRGETLQLEILRAGQLLALNVKPQIKNERNMLGISVQMTPDFFKPYQVLVKRGMFDAVIYGTERSYQLLALNLTMLNRMLWGNASIEHLKSPIGIAYYAGRSFQASFQTYLNFLALMSIAIAFFNLLPIPLLDGGHLFLYLIEMVKRKPATATAKNLFNYLGLLFIATLLSIALYNDVIEFVAHN